MRFQFPVLLALLLLLPILYRWWKHRDRPAVIFYPLAHRSFPFDAARSILSFFVKHLLLIKIAALAFLIVAIARPQSEPKRLKRNLEGIDIVVLLDVSPTMNIEDMDGKSRLDSAKETLERFVRGRENDRIGLVIFSGEAFTLAPLTLDYEMVLDVARDADKGILRDGTAQGDAVALAVNQLKNSTAKSKVIVFLTDGENNMGAIAPKTAADIAAGYGVKVYAIGIGKEGQVPYPEIVNDVFGREVKRYKLIDSIFYPEWLQELAKMTEGKFYRVTDGAAMKRVFDDINRLEPVKIQSFGNVRYDDRFMVPLNLGLLSLAMYTLLGLVFRVVT